jgi:hypothetical protein
MSPIGVRAACLDEMIHGEVPPSVWAMLHLPAEATKF